MTSAYTSMLVDNSLSIGKYMDIRAFWTKFAVTLRTSLVYVEQDAHMEDQLD